MGQVVAPCLEWSRGAAGAKHPDRPDRFLYRCSRSRVSLVNKRDHHTRLSYSHHVPAHAWPTGDDRTTKASGVLSSDLAHWTGLDRDSMGLRCAVVGATAGAGEGL